LGHRRQTTTWLTVIASAIVLYLAVTAGGSRRPAAFAINPRRVVVGLEGSPTTLDPRYTTDAYGARILPLLYDGLVAVDEHGAVVPNLAAGWENPGPRRYRFHLRPGVRFSDGRPCRAADVKATLDFLRQPANGCPAQGRLQVISEITVVDPLTVDITLRRPFASFLYALTAYIVPAACCRPDAADPATIPGTGAFKLVRFHRGSEIVLERHPGYRGRPARLERIVFKIIRDDTSRILALRKGAVDLVQNAIPAYALQFFARDGRFRLLSRPGSGYKYLGYNLEDPLTGRLALRRAISLAIDRQQIIRYTLHGRARPAAGLLPPEHWAANPRLPLPRHDPQAAVRLLDEAGLRPGPDGVRCRLSFKTSTNQESYEIAQIIKAQLARVGIELQIRRFEWGTFFADIKNGNFQLYSLKWVGIEDPDIFYYLFHSTSVPPRGANRGRFRDPEVDRLLEQSRLTLNRERRRQLFCRLQEIIAAREVYTSLWFRDDTVVVKKGLLGFRICPGGAYTSLREARWDAT